MTSTIKTDSSNAPIVGTVETKIATANCSSYVNRVVRVGNVVHASYATISTGGYISQQIGSNTSAIIISGMYTV